MKNNNKTSLKEKFNHLIQFLKNRWIINGLGTIGLIIIIFAIYWGANIVIDKIEIPDIDATKDKIYTVSEETKTRIKDIDKDINIILINYGESDTMKTFIEQYRATNKKIAVEWIDDLSSRIDLKQAYDLEEGERLILVRCDGKEKMLTEDSLHTIDYSTYEQIDLTEEAITNAIINVAADKKPIIYYMSNHTLYPFERAYADIVDVLEGDANEVKALNLLSAGKVPDDCDTFIITTLGEDITEMEKDYLVDYINNGGNLLILSGVSFIEDEMTNFNEILDLYDLSLANGILIEEDLNNKISGMPNFLIESVNSSSISKESNNKNNFKAYLPNATAIIKNNEEESEITYEEIINTSNQTFLRTNYSIVDEKRTSSDGEYDSFVTGIIARKTIDDEKTSKLVLFSNDMFATLQLQNYIMPAGNNSDLVANSVAFLNDKENMILIRKNFDVQSYSVTQQEHNTIMAVIFAIPALIFATGITVWQIRKRRRR